MKDVRVFYRWSLILVLISIGLYGCSSRPAYNPPTLTAQAVRARDMATRIAIDLRGTDDWERKQIEATSQAFQESLKSNENWPLIMNDSFDQNTDIWPTGSDEGSFANASWEIVDGKYRWQAEAKDAFVWWAYPDMDAVADFYLSADSEQISGPADGEWGLIYRVTPDDEYYLFEINARQEYCVYLHQGDEWEALVDWTPSDVIQMDQVNKLAVIAQGTQFLFFINDQFITQLSDDRLEAGNTGVLIGLSNAEDQGVWEFDNFNLRSPDLPEPTQTPAP
jgi:hypothetical protein